MSHEEQVEGDDLEKTQRTRREFMENAGKLAAYTPPVMLGLLVPGPHAIASGTKIEPPAGC